MSKLNLKSLNVPQLEAVAYTLQLAHGANIGKPPKDYNHTISRMPANSVAAQAINTGVQDPKIGNLIIMQAAALSVQKDVRASVQNTRKGGSPLHHRAVETTKAAVEVNDNVNTRSLKV